eukprot:scaffold296383_cov40-Tisochrysis_lutea.AAC.1
MQGSCVKHPAREQGEERRARGSAEGDSLRRDGGDETYVRATTLVESTVKESPFPVLSAFRRVGRARAEDLPPFQSHWCSMYGGGA